MDMAIFRMIFFELFSFLYVHAPYPPFRLLMNLGKHPKETQGTIFVRPIDNSTETNIKLLLLIVRGPHHGPQPFLHRILCYRHKSSVRATLLFSSQRAAERLLALTNPCWSLPIGRSWFTEVESKALLPYTPLKVKIWQ